MATPRISIVTICFNNPEELKLTCAHIDAQRLLPYEHHIIDGSRTDDIRRWLEDTPQPPYRKWLCEPDRGISDAFNKGVRRATGDIVHIQNSGDYYYDNQVLAEVAAAFEQQPGARWLHGKYAQFRGGMWLVAGRPFRRELLYRGMRTIGHPTMFVCRSLYEKYGLFSEDKKIAMDYDFLVRIADEPFIFLPRPLVYFTPGGVSEQRVEAGLKEVSDSYRQYHGFSAKQNLWHLRLRFLQQLMRSRAGRILFQLKNKHKGIDNPEK